MPKKGKKRKKLGEGRVLFFFRVVGPCNKGRKTYIYIHINIEKNETRKEKEKEFFIFQPS